MTNPSQNNLPANPCKNPPLILASASPRRAELLRQHGYAFEVIASTFDESALLDSSLSPTELAEALSLHKAQDVQRKIQSNRPPQVQPNINKCWILSGDTVAHMAGRIFGKPDDREHAKEILSSLAGTTHEVITGVTLLDGQSGKHITKHDVTRVIMRTLSDKEIEQYLDTNAWVGKAGAYGIQDHGDAFVDRIEGSFTNVVGFPMELIATMLKEWGWKF